MNEKNMNQKLKVFDDFPTVDCEECEHWQINRCDGHSVGTESSCTAFKVVRRLNTPQEIKALQKGYKDLTRASLINSIAIILLALAVILT